MHEEQSRRFVKGDPVGDIVVLIGPPSSGKSTLSEGLEKARGLRPVMSSQVVREAWANDKKKLRMLEAEAADGNLWTDKNVIPAVTNHLLLHRAIGCTVDGFPRTSAQAWSLFGYVYSLGACMRVIEIDVLDDVLYDRLKGRQARPDDGAFPKRLREFRGYGPAIVMQFREMLCEHGLISIDKIDGHKSAVEMLADTLEICSRELVTA